MSDQPPLEAVADFYDRLRGDTLQEALTSALITLRGLKLSLAAVYQILAIAPGPQRDVETVFDCLTQLIGELERKQAAVDAIPRTVQPEVEPPKLH